MRVEHQVTVSNRMSCAICNKKMTIGTHYIRVVGYKEGISYHAECLKKWIDEEIPKSTGTLDDS